MWARWKHHGKWKYLSWSNKVNIAAFKIQSNFIYVAFISKNSYITLPLYYRKMCVSVFVRFLTYYFYFALVFSSIFLCYVCFLLYAFLSVWLQHILIYCFCFFFAPSSDCSIFYSIFIRQALSINEKRCKRNVRMV